MKDCFFVRAEIKREQKKIAHSAEHERERPEVKPEKRWVKVGFDDILWVRALGNESIVFLTGERSLKVSHRLWRIEEMLTKYSNFVRINRTEIINVDAVGSFERNCYYIDGLPLYAIGEYRQRLEGVFAKAKQL